MKRIKPFNRLEITSNELDYLQDTGQDAIRQRLLDGLYSHGIVIPDDASPSAIESGLPTVFPITPNVTVISVGETSIANPSPHVAYDIYGERIELPYNDNIGATGALWNGQAPLFITSTVGGFNKSTPFSTGRLNVPASGNGVVGTKYVFVSYLPVTETVDLPPSHENSPSGVVNVSNRRLPITMIDQKMGTAYAHHRIDGYRVFIANDYDVTLTVGGTPIISNTGSTGFYPSLGEHHEAAIYIGKYVWNGSSVSGVVTESDSLDKRPLMLNKGTDVVGKVGDGTITTLPTSYAAGMWKTFQEHINAVGTGVVSPQDAHGITYADLGPIPVSEGHISANGLIDYSEKYRLRPRPSNSPLVDSDSAVGVMRAWIDNATSTTPPASYDKATVSAGVVTVVNVAAAPAFTNGVYLTPLATGQAIMIRGAEVTTVAPVATYSAVSTPFVSFAASDITGEWVIFAVYDGGRAVLGKWHPATQGVLPTTCVQLAKVNWTQIGAIYYITPSVQDKRTSIGGGVKLLATDLRSVGTISLEQVSTDAMAHPTEGLLARQNFVNMVSNPDGRYYIAGTPSTAYEWGNTTYVIDPVNNAPTLASGTLGTISVFPISSTIYPGLNMDTTGPKNGSGLMVALTPTSNGINKSIGITVPNLKPDTDYVAEMWIAASGVSSNTVRVTARFVDTTGATSRIVEWKNAGNTIEWSKDINFSRDGAWYKVALPLKTLKDGSRPTVTDVSDKLAINFYHNDSLMTTPCNIAITNLVITEGEWTHGAGITRPPVRIIKGRTDGGGNCPASIGSSSTAGVVVTKTLFEFNTATPGANPSIVSTGQNVSVLCACPYRVNYDVAPAIAGAWAFSNVVGHLYIDGVEVLANTSVPSWGGSWANGVVTVLTNGVGQVLLNWSTSFLPSGSHTIKATVVVDRVGYFAGNSWAPASYSIDVAILSPTMEINLG